MKNLIKRILELSLSILILCIIFPIIIISMILIVIEDPSESPLFLHKRVGENHKIFKLLKLRSMKKVNGYSFSSTSSNDPRILKIGNLIRKFKIDELPQLFNIIRGEMSFVGPRPNVYEDVIKYNNYEKRLLNLKPGITDPSSIIFSDESEILKNSKNPDNDYNLIIRPWKNLFAIYYFKKNNYFSDFIVICLTVSSAFKKKFALNVLSNLMRIKDNQLSYQIINRKIDLKNAIISPPINCNLP